MLAPPVTAPAAPAAVTPSFAEAFRCWLKLNRIADN